MQNDYNYCFSYILRVNDVSKFSILQFILKDEDMYFHKPKGLICYYLLFYLFKKSPVMTTILKNCMMYLGFISKR